MRLEAKVGDKIYLATHTSVSEDCVVAESFADGGGVVLEFDSNIHPDEGISKHADVSWM